MFTTVDDLNYAYVVDGSPEETLDQLQRELPREGRVECVRSSPRELEVMTVQHTPAWARFFLLPILLLTVRVTRVTHIVAESAPEGCRLQVKGRLDTRAAEQLRSLRPDSVRLGPLVRS
jgi:hypothetical protein